jgi:hypothetical protein
VWVAAWDPHHENVVYSGAACFDIHCPDASSSPCGAYAEHRDGWHLTVPVYSVVGAGRLPVESWGPATRAVQHPARCMLLVACCMCCLLHVATACCNVGSDDCQWKVWDLRHAQRKPVFTCKPVAMGVTAVRIRSASPSWPIPLGPAHTEGALGCGRGLMADDRRSWHPRGTLHARQATLVVALRHALHAACCMLSVVRCPRSHSTFIARCCG